MKTLYIPGFMLMTVIQLFIPAKMIWNQEEVLLKGKLFHFQVEPIDPSDPFIGKFIWLNFKEDTFHASKNSLFINNQKVFAELDTNKEGKIYIRNLHIQPPKNTTDYVSVEIQHILGDNLDEKLVIVQFPFEKFYLNEQVAPEAERLYHNAAADSINKMYAMVYIYKGRGITRDIIINNRSIRTYLK